MMKSPILESWSGVQCVLATMHKKESIIAPLLKESLGLEVCVPESFNSDQFGTFSGEVTRTGNQLEAARAKALAALTNTPYHIAIASEGSFGTHPAFPALPQNLELVLLIDTKHDLEIRGHCANQTLRAERKTVTTVAEALAVAHDWGFPDQGVIVRLQERGSRHLYKELTTEADLERISKRLLKRWFTNHIYLEKDLRAHRCPERWVLIQKATEDLIKNCLSLCPACEAPGFVVTKTEAGLPCGDCGHPTEAIQTITRTCQKCSYSSTEQVTALANPADCQYCNP